MLPQEAAEVILDNIASNKDVLDYESYREHSPKDQWDLWI